MIKVYLIFVSTRSWTTIMNSTSKTHVFVSIIYLILDEKLFNDVIETILIFEVKVMLAVWEDDKAENVNFKSIIILQHKGISTCRQVMDRVPGEAWRVLGFRKCHGEIG